MAGFILLFVGYFVVPESETISLKHVIVFGSIALYFIFLSFHTAYKSFSEERNMLPDVLYAADAPKAMQSSVALLLLEPSQLFSYDCAVAVYMNQDDIETIIGLGRVTNVQSDGKIQILVIYDMGYSDEWEGVRKNNASSLRKLLVKPTVPAFAMEAISND